MGAGQLKPGRGKAKKLIEAGYRWASSDDSGDLEEDAKHFNLPASWTRKPAPFIVNHDGWAAFDVFIMCSTQWNVSPMGKRTGLNYPAVMSVLQFIGLEPSRELLEQIKCLEAGALAATYGQPLSSTLNG